MPIQAILFDLGGVILDLEPARTQQALAALGGRDFAAVWSPATQAPFFEAYETGHLSTPAFRAQLRAHLHIPSMPGQATDAALDAAWNAMLVGIQSPTVVSLAQLRKTLPIFLLSNTNDLHVAHIEAAILPAHNIVSLSALFEGVYLSQDIGWRKPQPQAFAHAVHHIGLPASSILFVDDLPDNVEGAQRVGLRGHHHHPGSALAAMGEVVARYNARPD